MKKKILVASGGSGGHIIPATVFYDLLKENYNPVISTDERGINYIDKKKYNLKIINTPRILNQKFYIPIKLIMIFILFIKSIIFLRNKKIHSIISTGGYAPIPLCLAGIFLKIDIYIYEPNLVIGKSNKFFLSRCKKIFIHSYKIKNFPKKFKKKIVVLSPLVRKKFYQKKRNMGKFFKIMVIGGSQGAKRFDKIFHNIFFEISKKIKLKVIHQTKEKNLNFLKTFYKEKKILNEVFSFKKNIFNLVRDCDFCITRAGASTLGELFTMKIPFLTIPLSNSIYNHQYENGKYYLEKGCCWMIDENKISGSKLNKYIKEIIINRKKFNNKRSTMIKLNRNMSFNKQKNIIIKTLDEN